MDADRPLSIVTVTCADSEAAARWLFRAEAVHRQLRDRLPPGFDAYRAALARVLAGGARLSLATVDETVEGLALWRIVDNTYELRRLYVDDLVVEAACRSRGVGHALIAWLEREARALSCAALALDSGVQRNGAHRFYFREGFSIPAFCFRKTLA
ncbi:MAG: GNAT family N-acetyltransferase [Azoarcus sp.]|jgi:GNAT superfamily N-acetyltransferase|nr:GNAT family N-acetyltransferase [Azoarcus sp.]